MSQYLQEAFKQFKLLEGEEFNIDASGIEDMKSFIEDDEAVDFTDIIDPEAETEEELEDSYIGKVILDCKVCHSKIYKSAEDVNYDEETETANEGEECPFCYSVDGFDIVGQVAPYQETEVNVEVEPKEDEVEVEETEIEESCKGKKCKKNKPIKEAWGYSKDEHVQEFERVVDELEEYGEANLYDVIDMLLSKFSSEQVVGYTDLIKQYYDVKDEVEDDFDESLKEGLENLDIETEHDKIHVQAEEKEPTGEEVIAPIEPAQEADILNKPEEEEEEEIEFDEGPSEEEVDYELDDFEEEPFNTMGESYLKRVYENVNSFKTTEVRTNGNNLIIEGVINFKSGKNKKTSFKFEAKDCTRKNKVRFIGENLQISKGKKSFTLRGTMDGSRFLPESFNYNYTVNGNKVRGSVKSPRRK